MPHLAEYRTNERTLEEQPLLQDTIDTQNSIAHKICNIAFVIYLALVIVIIARLFINHIISTSIPDEIH